MAEFRKDRKTTESHFYWTFETVVCLELPGVSLKTDGTKVHLANVHTGISISFFD